ncbi:MAG: DUF2141 domain-containing protein [Saprospiraceae bacterium]|nr:DUF2141 domain-containing protein [Saprospiraceae bacterium]
MKKTLLFLLAFGAMLSFGQSQNKGTIKVVVYGLRNNSGQVGIRIFNKPEGFPSDGAKVLKEIFVKPANGEATFELPNWSFGTYAIGSIHDENGNKDLDKNFIGIPKEGFGTSNNPNMTFGTPSFKTASFGLNQPESTVKIKMVYF